MSHEATLPTAVGAPATRALTAAGYTSSAQLDGVSAREPLALHGVGPKAVGILGEAMAAEGLVLRL